MNATRAARELALAAGADGISHTRAFAQLLSRDPIEGRLVHLRRIPPTVAFSARDARAPGFVEACRRAAALGFRPVVRNVGGTFAPMHTGSLLVDEWGCRVDAGVHSIARFDSHTVALLRALARVGVRAEVGELRREYCPGAHSIHAGGAKICGTAQRVSGRAWVVSTVVQLDGAEALRRVTTAVADALGQDVDPATIGSVSLVTGSSVDVDAFSSHVLDALGPAIPVL